MAKELLFDTGQPIGYRFQFRFQPLEEQPERLSPIRGKTLSCFPSLGFYVLL